SLVRDPTAPFFLPSSPSSPISTLFPYTTLFRSFRTTHANSAFLAEFTVFTCPIDSIDQYGLRIISMSFFILFNRVPQPGAFVVGIPRQHIQKSISTYEADR